MTDETKGEVVPFRIPTRSPGRIVGYTLDGHEPVPAYDTLEWAKWFETNDMTVGKTTVNGILVSTVFLALDHNFSGGTPILFESILFAGDEQSDMLQRYHTWEEAEEGHWRLVAALCKKHGAILPSDMPAHLIEGE